MLYVFLQRFRIYIVVILDYNGIFETEEWTVYLP